MDTNGDCLGVVLAGGRSLRMGADKARLQWGGQLLIDRAVAMLRAAGCPRVLVSGDYPGYVHVADRYPERGPLGGLASVAEVARESLWLVLAVDQPLVDAALLRPLLDCLESRSETDGRRARHRSARWLAQEVTIPVFV